MTPRDDGAASVRPAERPIRGTWTPPGDKSISHRAAILASMADGTSTIDGYSPAGDCSATLEVLEGLGVFIGRSNGAVAVRGPGLPRFQRPSRSLDCRRSGTTMRLMAGVLAAAPFPSTLTGAEQLLRRPMERVARPLRLMGARVDLAPGDRPPIAIEGGPLQGIPYRLPLPSAQVKSAVLLAGLSASGSTTVIESVPSRDHTERLLEWLELDLERSELDDGSRVAIVSEGAPRPFRIRVPGDISSAAFMIVGAALVAGSDLVVTDVGLNPTRMGLVRALVLMACLVPWALGDRGRHALRAGTEAERGPELLGAMA